MHVTLAEKFVFIKLHTELILFGLFSFFFASFRLRFSLDSRHLMTS